MPSNAAPLQPRSRGALLIAPLALLTWAVVAWLLFFASGDASASGEDEFHHVDMHLSVYQDGQWWDVEIGMFIEDDGEGDFEDAYHEARDEMLARFPGAYQSDSGHVHGEYVANGYSWPGAGTSWSYDSSGKPSGLSGDSSAMNAGANAWGSAGFNFSGGGSSSAGTGACNSSTDGNNTVGWAPKSGSVLAVTCTWYSGGRAVEFDMEFDPDWNWTTGGSTSVDLQSVAVHEFGHALGLGHSSVSSAVMVASYSTGSTKRSLHPDDIAGVEAIYGSDEPTNTPTNTPEPTNTPTNTPEPTSTPTNTPEPTSTPTSEPEPTSTPVGDTSAPNTPTPGTSPGGSNTPAPTATPEATPNPADRPAAPDAPDDTSEEPTPTPTVPGSLPILPGANLVGWTGEDADPAEVFRDRGNVVRAVYSWNPGKGWERYGPGLPPWVNSLKTLRKGDAYWVISSGSTQVSMP